MSILNVLLYILVAPREYLSNKRKQATFSFSLQLLKNRKKKIKNLKTKNTYSAIFNLEKINKPKIRERASNEDTDNCEFLN